MPPPLSRCSRWAYSSLKITHPCQPSPIPLSCRPAHRPFRDLLGVHSRCGLHTRAVTVFRDRYPGASDISSPPCLPRLLPAGAVAGWALHPLEKRRLVTAHVESRRSFPVIDRSRCAIKQRPDDFAKTDLTFALPLLPIKEIGLRHWVGHLQDLVDLYPLVLRAEAHLALGAHTFSSRLSSSRKRHSVLSAIIFCGVDLMRPTSRRRKA